MFYVYDPTTPLPTLCEVEDGADVGVLAEEYPECVYFEFVPLPTIREEALRFAREFIDTISDPTQAVDLAWSDMISGVEALFNPNMDDYNPERRIG